MWDWCSSPKDILDNLKGCEVSRDDWIRTSDLCVPNAALYQAEPRPDRGELLAELFLPVHSFRDGCLCYRGQPTERGCSFHPDRVPFLLIFMGRLPIIRVHHRAFRHFQ